MAERRGWQAANIDGMESFRMLSQREQGAVRRTLSGLRAWRASGEAPKPMRVEITEERPFDFRGFAQVCHELGIGVTGGIRRDGENAFVFQPRPYNEETLKRPESRIRGSGLSAADIEVIEKLVDLFRWPGSTSAS